MVSFKNIRNNAVDFSDLLTEIEILLHTKQQLEEENELLRQEFMQLSSKLRQDVEEMRQLMIELKDSIQKKRLGEKFNEVVVDFDTVLTHISAWLDNKDKEHNAEISERQLAIQNLLQSC